jgi:hypothetical protein
MRCICCIVRNVPHAEGDAIKHLGMRCCCVSMQLQAVLCRNNLIAVREPVQQQFPVSNTHNICLVCVRYLLFCMHIAFTACRTLLSAHQHPVLPVSCQLTLFAAFACCRLSPVQMCQLQRPTRMPTTAATPCSITTVPAWRRPVCTTAPLPLPTAVVAAAPAQVPAELPQQASCNRPLPAHCNSSKPTTHPHPLTHPHNSRTVQSYPVLRGPSSTLFPSHAASCKHHMLVQHSTVTPGCPPPAAHRLT